MECNEGVIYQRESVTRRNNEFWDLCFIPSGTLFRNISSWLEEWGQLHFPTWTYAQTFLASIKDTNHVKIALSLQVLKDIIRAKINNT